MIIVIVLLVGVAVVGIVFAFGLRRAVFDIGKTDTELKRPGSHTLAYRVPEGQDPAVLQVALHHAGFRCIADDDGGTQRVLVECQTQGNGDRARVREVIEQVHTTGIDGVALDVVRAKFEDEA